MMTTQFLFLYTKQIVELTSQPCPPLPPEVAAWQKAMVAVSAELSIST